MGMPISKKLIFNIFYCYFNNTKSKRFSIVNSFLQVISIQILGKNAGKKSLPDSCFLLNLEVIAYSKGII